MTETSTARPLALGYVRQQHGQTPAQVGRLKAELSFWAWREGWFLGPIWTERGEPSGFEALADAAVRNEARAVIVPGPGHLSPAQVAALSRRAHVAVHLVHPK